MEEALVDVKELKKRYGPPTSWWYAQAFAGTVPSYKLGKYVRFRLSEVEAWIQTQRKKPLPAGTNGTSPAGVHPVGAGATPKPQGRATAR